MNNEKNEQKEKKEISASDVTIHITNLNGEENSEDEVNLSYLNKLEQERLATNEDAQKNKKKRLKKKRRLMKNYNDGQVGSLIFRIVSIFIILVCFVMLSFTIGTMDNADGLEALIYYLLFWPLFILPFGIGSFLAILVFAGINVILFLINAFRIIRIWRSNKKAKLYVILNFIAVAILFALVVLGFMSVAEDFNAMVG